MSTESTTVGFCTCLDVPMRDCGIPSHRAEGYRIRGVIEPPTGEQARDRLIAAIDALHENAWCRGEAGSLTAHKAADALADALGWHGDHGTTPDGPWLRARLSEVLR